jgi:hypothetical protein
MLMLRENLKWQPHKRESTDAAYRGGRFRSSEEVSVMEMERREPVIQFETTRQLNALRI